MRGLRAAEPISADADLVVHRWVDGSKVPEEPVRVSYAFEIGEILARVHSVGVEWTHVSIEDSMPTDWPELAARAAVSQQSWARELLAVPNSRSHM